MHPRGDNFPSSPLHFLRLCDIIEKNLCEAIMKDEFMNKRIVFLGDSIAHDGGFCYNIRSALRHAGKRCEVFNRGVGGTRAVMAKYMLEEEIFPLSPDVVFISFGVNDLGVWLYDSKKEVTPELVEKRRARDEEYIASMRDIVLALKARGITPVCQTPYPVNELLIEKPDIDTIADNDEKEDNLGPSFYRRATFKNINTGLAYYSELIKSTCEELEVAVVDTFAYLHELIHREDGLFIDDGCHFTEKGHGYIARCLVDFMGVECNGEFTRYHDMDEARRVEELIRDIMMYRRATMLPESIWPRTTHEDILSSLGKLLGNKDYWNAAKLPSVLENYEKIDELREKEINLICAL